MTAFLLAAAAFLAMEVFAAVMHRLVMHGPGHRWHRFHHGPATKSFDANDWFPVLFATATIAVIFVGSRVDELSFLMWIGAGITGYGAAYLIVHDICTHGRFVGAPIGNRGYLGYVRRAHRVHHLGGRAPYGFLLPVLGRRHTEERASLQRRAGRRDPSGRPISAAAATEAFRAVDTDARNLNTS